MSRNMYVTLCIVTASLVLFRCSLTIQDMRADAEAAKRPYGSFTESQIIAKSQPLFSALLPSQYTLSLVAERQGDGWREGSVHRIWNVQCFDLQNTRIASILFDADTGRAQQVSARLPLNTPRISMARSISSTSAVATASEWIAKLGYPGHWRLSEQPTASDQTWHVKLGTSGQTALLIIDKHSSALIYASITGRFSRYSGAQVGAKALPLFGELLRERSTASIRVERQHVIMQDGSSRRQWSVTCIDTRKNVLARSVRDADTGEIVLFTGELLSEPGGPMQHQSISSEQSISAARHWVKLMGYTQEEWRASVTLPRSARVLHLQLTTAGKSAVLTLDQHTGKLIFASVRTKV